jgi:hypothetical protein
MRRRSRLAFGLLVVFLSPPAARAQTAPSPSAGTLDAVVKELRLLRQVMERQGWATARAQLLIGRLTLQDQRTARAQQLQTGGQ